MHAETQTAVDLRTAMPSAAGWDWHDLQDNIVAKQRKNEAKRLSAEDYEALWNAELKSKDDKIAELDARIDSLRKELADVQAAQTNGSVFIKAEHEIYLGEYSDRILSALRFCIEKGADAGWDSRSLALFRVICDRMPVSTSMAELREDLKRATREPKRANAQLTALLGRHGFVYKSDNKHTRLEPRAEFAGLSNITLPNTPGDVRSLDNLCSQIEQNLGLTQLKKSR